MACVEWHDRYLLGVPVLDEQHQHLFAFANKLADLIYARPVRSDWEHAKAELIGHTLQHFRYEEATMVDAGYPGTADHRIQHAELVSQLQRFCASSDPTRLQRSDTGHRAITFLRQWLLHHISLSDRSMVEWLHHQGAPLRLPPWVPSGA